MATVDHVLQAHSLDVTRQAELIHILVDTTHGSNHKYRSKFCVSLKRFYPQLQVLVQQLKQLASLKTKAHWGKSLGGGGATKPSVDGPNLYFTSFFSEQSDNAIQNLTTNGKSKDGVLGIRTEDRRR